MNFKPHCCTGELNIEAGDFVCYTDGLKMESGCGIQTSYYISIPMGKNSSSFQVE